MEDYLFTLPENERNTVKAFLLMQQERIENLEKTVHELRCSRLSKMWKLKGFTSISELEILATKVKDIDLLAHRICYNKNTFDVFIEFWDINSKFAIEDLLKNINFSHIEIITTRENVSYYNVSCYKDDHLDWIYL